MLRDITIGQYYPTGSVIHKLDPRVKLVATCLFIISIFTIKSFAGYIAAAGYLLAVIAVSGVPLRYILKGFRAVLILIIFTAAFNLYAAGVKSALFFVIRIIFVIMGSSLLTYTTTPKQLTDGIEKLLGPLNKIRIPVHEFALIMSLALRFIPILVEETDKIIKAQTSRGANYDEGGLIAKAKSVVSLLIPLLVSAIRRATELALAMDARCYNGGEGRTKMKPLLYVGRDYVAYVIVLLYLIVSFILGRYVIL